MKRHGTAAAALPHAAAFLTTAVLWAAALALFGIYPFGDRSILITDMGQQYIEYHAALYDAVTGGGSLFYTWNTGLGMNFVGLFSYYLSSPFTLLMFLFPRSAITESVLLIISAKIAFSGLTFSIFLRRSSGVKGIINILFSALYALSAYPVVYCFNLMWLDAVVLLPLVMLALYHTINSGKTALLTTVFALLFFSNFYTAYMVGLFSFLALIAIVWLRRLTLRDGLRTAGRFFLAGLIAAGLTAFLTLPTVFALSDCQGTLAADNLFLGLMTDPLTLLGKFSFGSYDSITDSGSPYLYCGVLTFGLIPVWILNKNISKREKTAGIALISVLLISMMFSVTDFLWHAAEIPIWFPCRYSFVLIFVLLVFAARAISRPDGFAKRHVVIGFSAAAVLFLAVKLPELLFPDVCETITGSLWITLGALIVYALLILLMMQPRRWLKRLSLLLIAVCVCVELIGNALSTFNSLDHELHFEKRADYLSFMEQSRDIRDALKQADQNPGGFYRTENSRARNANDGMSAGYHAVSHYSSFSRRDTFRFLRNCGMMCLSGCKIFRYYGSAAALDSILGVRYVFGPDEERYGYVKTDITANNLPLWKNENALPLAYYADHAVLDMPVSADSPFEMLNLFLSSLSGEQKSYYIPLVVTSYFNGEEIADTDKHFNIKEPGFLSFVINNPRRQNVLLYLDNNFNEFTQVYLNGEALNTHYERLIRGVIELGELDEGESVVSLSVTEEKRWLSDVCAASFDAKEFDSLSARLRRHVPEKLTVSETGWREPLIDGLISAPGDGVLFTSIPADKGWTAKIDGRKVRPASVGGAFIALPLSKGEHSFSLHYKPRGLTSGIILSALTLIIWVYFLIRKGRRKKIRAK